MGIPRTPQEMQNMNELEHMIHTMERTQILCCLPTAGCHSFQTVHMLLTGSVRSCQLCQTRMQSVVFLASSDSSKQIVKCVACGLLAHRTCAVSRHTHWNDANACHVNRTRIRERIAMNQQQQKRHQNHSVTAPSLLDQAEEQQQQQDWENDDTSNDDEDDDDDPAVEQETPASSPLMEWTTEGPPRHWAMDNPHSIVSTITIPKEVPSPSSSNSDKKKKKNDRNQNNDNDEEDDDFDSDPVHITSLHHVDHPFASVSRALQENVIAHFLRGKGTTATESAKSETDTKGNSSTPTAIDSATAALQVQTPPTMDHEHKEEQQQSSSSTTMSQFANAVRTTVNLPAKLGMVSVAGGIAGGVAGLAMAGPAGAYAGYQMGETLGALGVILEGSVSIGVFVASVATASMTAQKIQTHMEERRILTMGEEGISRKVLLVRPNIYVDPAWDDICREAKRQAPMTSSGAFFFVGDNHASTQKARYRRDEDIVQQPEQDIPTQDKVLLLAGRILNDKSSLPGHVYRSLMDTFEKRCTEPIETSDGPSRRRRDDVHAVIKHVTATLLEVRPGFGHNKALTELTATAVEGFVFGRVYDLVFQEIQEEVNEKDSDLVLKIEEFERTRPGAQEIMHHISESALQALRMLPSSHTAVEKLSSCTRFLEQISEHFSQIHGSSGGLCADSLLKMVCQHVLMAKLSGINAEIAFLEEFARDEQLLRGKEGYSLVTLQAALHFLNRCSDIENDIFEQDNDERNVPVTPSDTQRAIAHSLGD